MLRSLSNWFYRVVSWKTLLPALLLDLFFMGYAMPSLSQHMNDFVDEEVKPLDLLMFNFDTELIGNMIESYGDHGRLIYVWGELTFDFIYPLAYTTAFCLLLSFVYKKRPLASFPLVNLMPLLVFASDLLENGCIVYLLTAHPTFSTPVASALTVFSALKWASVLIVIAFFLIGLIRLLFPAKQKQEQEIIETE